MTQIHYVKWNPLHCSPLSHKEQFIKCTPVNWNPVRHENWKSCKMKEFNHWPISARDRVIFEPSVCVVSFRSSSCGGSSEVQFKDPHDLSGLECHRQDFGNSLQGRSLCCYKRRRSQVKLAFFLRVLQCQNLPIDFSQTVPLLRCYPFSASASFLESIKSVKSTRLARVLSFLLLGSFLDISTLLYSGNGTDSCRPLACHVRRTWNAVLQDFSVMPEREPLPTKQTAWAGTDTNSNPFRLTATNCQDHS